MAQTNQNIISNQYRNIYIYDFTAICNANNVDCQQKERSKTFAYILQIPTQLNFDDITLKECCVKNLVLADLNSDVEWKNDKYGIYHYRQTNEQIEFVLINILTGTETDLNNNTFGDFADFNTIQDNENLSYYILEWKKVLQNLGEGQYKIVKRFTIGSISTEIVINGFQLKQYRNDLANKTVRFDVIMNGYFEKLQANFNNSNFISNFRIKGFFGNREPKLEEDYLIDRNYKKNQISNKLTNEYKFQSNLVPECVTKELWDFILLADDIKISDYNFNNHSFNYKLFPVKFENNDGSDYSILSRKVKLNLTFSDRYENNIKKNY